MGLFDRKPKKEDIKVKKSQEEEERMKKELETLQSILEKSDFKADQAKTEAAPRIQERPAEKAQPAKPVKAVEKAPERPGMPAGKMPVPRPQAQKIPAERPQAKPESAPAPKPQAKPPVPPVLKPILKPSILQPSQPQPAPKPVPTRAPEKAVAEETAIRQPEPVKAVYMPEPAKVEAIPEPKLEPVPEPVKAEPKPEPAKVEAIPEPKREPVKIEAMPELKPEPKHSPAANEPGIAELKALVERQAAEFEKARLAMEEQRSLLKQQNDGLSGQMLVLKAKIDRMEAERSSIPQISVATTDRLEEQIREGRAMIDTQKLTIEMQKDTISRMEEEVEKIKAFDFEEYAAQEKQILAKIATELKALKTGITEYDGKTADVSGKVGAIGGDLGSLKDRTENIEQDAFAARRTMDECAKTLEVFRAIITEQSANVDQMKNSVTILDSKVNSLRDTVSAGPGKPETEEIEALKAQMGGWGEEIKSLRESLESVNGRLESVTTVAAGEAAAVKGSLALDITSLRESVASDLASVKDSMTSEVSSVKDSLAS